MIHIRKVTLLTYAPAGDNGGYLYAVCDDGTMWRRSAVRFEADEWSELEPVCYDDQDGADDGE